MATEENKTEPATNEAPETSQAGDAPDIGEIFAAWEFPEFESHARSMRWYLVSIPLMAALFFYAYWDNNPLLAVILILGIIVFIVTEMRGADYHSFAIAEDGVVVGENFYPYEQLRSFYIIYQPPNVKLLYIDPKSVFRPKMGVPLDDQDPVALRELLLRYIPEDLEREDEPFSDFLGRIFKF